MDDIARLPLGSRRGADDQMVAALDEVLLARRSVLTLA